VRYTKRFETLYGVLHRVPVGSRTHHHAYARCDSGCGHADALAAESGRIV